MGGMGEVFLADDTQLERKIAVKFLPDELQDDPVARGRFEREAKSAAALDHPYICKIYEFAKVDGHAAIVMEHVAGQTLESKLAEGPLAPAQAIQIAAEMAEAHARRIIHRDLKPANLMLTEQGHVKVMDFGLTKRMRDPGGSDSQDLTPGSLTQTGALLGTPAYMAPEQVRAGEVDARFHIFSLGAVLFELLTGEHPFKRGTLSDTIAAILRDPPSRTASGGGQIGYAIFDKLLEKAPVDRYQSFDAVSIEVRRLRDVSSTWTEPVSAVADDGEPSGSGSWGPGAGRRRAGCREDPVSRAAARSGPRASLSGPDRTVLRNRGHGAVHPVCRDHHFVPLSAAGGPPLVCTDADRPQCARGLRQGANDARRSAGDVWGDRNPPASRDGPGDAQGIVM